MSDILISRFNIDNAKLIAHNHYPPRWGAARNETSLYFHEEHGYIVEKVYGTKNSIRRVSTAEARALFQKLPFWEVGSDYKFVPTRTPSSFSPAAITYRRGEKEFYTYVRRALDAGITVNVYNAPETGLFPLLARNGIKANVTFVGGFHVLEPVKRKML